MATRSPEGSSNRKRKQAHPVPDTDSLSMDDRGTRPYRTSHSETPHAENPESPGIPDPEEGNHIGDPVQPGRETIRATDACLSDVPDEATASSDAPTIIRDLPQRRHH